MKHTHKMPLSVANSLFLLCFMIACEEKLHAANFFTGQHNSPKSDAAPAFSLSSTLGLDRFFNYQAQTPQSPSTPSKAALLDKQRKDALTRLEAENKDLKAIHQNYTARLAQAQKEINILTQKLNNKQPTAHQALHNEIDQLKQTIAHLEAEKYHPLNTQALEDISQSKQDSTSTQKIRYSQSSKANTSNEQRQQNTRPQFITQKRKTMSHDSNAPIDLHQLFRGDAISTTQVSQTPYEDNTNQQPSNYQAELARLHKQINILKFYHKKQVAKLTREKTLLDNENKKLQAQHNQATQQATENKALKEALNQIKTRQTTTQQLQTQLTDIKQEKTQLDEQNKLLAKDNKDKIAQLKQQQNKLATLKSQQEQNKKELATITNKANTLAQEKQDLESDISKHVGQYQELTLLKEQKEKENNELTQQLTQYEQQVTNFKEAKAQNQQLHQDALNKLKTAYQQAQAKNKQLSKKIDTMNASQLITTKQHKDKLTKVQAQQTQLQTQLTDIKQAKTQLNERNKLLDKENKDKKAQLQHQQNELATLKSQQEQNKKELTTITNKANTLAQEKQALQTNINKQVDQYKALTLLKEQKEKENNELTQQLTQYEQQVTNFKAIKAQNQQLHQQLNQLYHSQNLSAANLSQKPTSIDFPANNETLPINRRTFLAPYMQDRKVRYILCFTVPAQDLATGLLSGFSRPLCHF